MVQASSSCPSGQYQASGFLVGPRILITALHVIEENGVACSVSVTQEGTGQTAAVSTYDSWYTSSTSDASATDFAVALLDRPLAGYYFRLAATSPRPGSKVLGLGYSLGEDLGFNQGHVTWVGNRAGGIPTIIMSLLGAKGSSGGPILNAGGSVVGLTQRGASSSSSSTVLSLDLARFTRGQASMLCQGVAVGNSSTLCGNSVIQPVAPPVAQPAQPPPAQAAPVAIDQCWVTEQPTNFDPAAKIYQTTTGYPTLYFVTHLTAPPGTDVIARSTIYTPYGRVFSTYSWTWTGQYQSWETSLHWTSYAQGGKWLFRIELSNGLSCQYVFNIVR